MGWAWSARRVFMCVFSLPVHLHCAHLHLRWHMPSPLPAPLQEPLPPDSPLWRHPKVRVFPHASCTPDMPRAVAQMVRLRELLLAGKPLPPEVVVDRQRGY